MPRRAGHHLTNAEINALMADIGAGVLSVIGLAHKYDLSQRNINKYKARHAKGNFKPVPAGVRSTDEQGCYLNRGPASEAQYYGPVRNPPAMPNVLAHVAHRIRAGR